MPKCSSGYLRAINSCDCKDCKEDVEMRKKWYASVSSSNYDIQENHLRTKINNIQNVFRGGS